LPISKRYFIFLIGILFQAAGIALVIKSILGTSPISSIPFILSFQYPFSLGETTFFVNMLFLLGQILILQKKFRLLQLFQIPVTAIFSSCIDLSMFLFAAVLPTTYITKVFLLLIGSALLALGVAFQVIANVIMLAGEGIVYAISTRWHIDFGKIKTGFDTSLLIIAALLSYLYFGEIRGIREGTLISALVTGSIARFYIKRLTYVNKNGDLIFAFFPNTKTK
jgi:uncharacterized membrane protein YczE